MKDTLFDKVVYIGIWTLVITVLYQIVHILIELNQVVNK